MRLVYGIGVVVAQLVYDLGDSFMVVLGEGITNDGLEPTSLIGQLLSVGLVTVLGLSSQAIEDRSYSNAPAFRLS